MRRAIEKLLFCLLLSILCGSSLVGCQSEDTVIDKYTDLLKKDSKNHNYLNRRGLRYEELNQPEKALADYSAAIKLSPETATYHYNNGNVYLTLRKYPLAIKNYQKAIELQADNVDYFNNLGVACNLNKDYRLAIKSFSSAIWLDPQNPDSYYGRALAYLNEGNQEKAELDYEVVKQLEPDYPYSLEPNQTKDNVP